MAKRETIDLTTDVDTVGGLAPIKKRGPVAPVRRGGHTLWLQDGQWLPSWLVWLRRRKFSLLLALLALTGAVAAARLLLAGRR